MDGETPFAGVFEVMFHWLRLHLTEMKLNRPITTALLSKKKKKSY